LSSSFPKLIFREACLKVFTLNNSVLGSLIQKVAAAGVGNNNNKSKNKLQQQKTIQAIQEMA
jgi:hypothetical protein